MPDPIANTASTLASVAAQVMSAPAPQPILKTAPPHPKTVLTTDFRQPVAQQVKNTGHVDMMA